MSITIRQATISNLKTITELCMILYEARDYAYLENENLGLLNNKNQAIFLAFNNKKVVAFIHCTLRFDYVKSTSSSPVGYLEGIYVEPEYRKKGLARKLVTICENWAKEIGSVEFASDCEMDNDESYKFHLKIGFMEANRNIHFIKKL